jgi:hypothetical protein
VFGGFNEGASGVTFSSTEQFLGGLTVTVAADQDVYVSASLSVMGSFQNPSDGEFLLFWIAFQPTGGTLTNVGPVPQGLSMTGTGGDLAMVSLSAVIKGLAPGTYQVGLAGEQGPASSGASATAVSGSVSALVFFDASIT